MMVARRQHHDRKVLVDQSIGAVLQLSCWVAFSMRVGDFLELERSFASDRVMNAQSEVQELLRLKMVLSKLFRQFVPGPEIALDRVRKPLQSLQIGTRDLRCHPAPFPRQKQRHQIENRNLRG